MRARVEKVDVLGWNKSIIDQVLSCSSEGGWGGGGGINTITFSEPDGKQNQSQSNHNSHSNPLYHPTTFPTSTLTIGQEEGKGDREDGNCKLYKKIGITESKIEMINWLHHYHPYVHLNSRFQTQKKRSAPPLTKHGTLYNWAGGGGGVPVWYG